MVAGSSGSMGDAQSVAPLGSSVNASTAYLKVNGTWARQLWVSSQTDAERVVFARLEWRRNHNTQWQCQVRCPQYLACML